METIFSIFTPVTGLLLLLLLLTTPSLCQYSPGCTQALEDVPDPSSDSCQAFFRCYSGNQYSLRCPLGQVFDFDRSRCRLSNSVNCELQLQRFQAPAVPGYMWPNQRSPHEGDVEIRVVHVGPDNGIVTSQAGQTPANHDGQTRAAQPQLPQQPTDSHSAQGQNLDQGRLLPQDQGQLPAFQVQGRPQHDSLPNFLPGSQGR